MKRGVPLRKDLTAAVDEPTLIVRAYRTDHNPDHSHRRHRELSLPVSISVLMQGIGMALSASQDLALKMPTNRLIRSGIHRCQLNGQCLTRQRRRRSKPGQQNKQQGRQAAR